MLQRYDGSCTKVVIQGYSEEKMHKLMDFIKKILMIDRINYKLFASIWGDVFEIIAPVKWAKLSKYRYICELNEFDIENMSEEWFNSHYTLICSCCRDKSAEFFDLFKKASLDCMLYKGIISTFVIGDETSTYVIGRNGKHIEMINRLYEILS